MYNKKQKNQKNKILNIYQQFLQRFQKLLKLICSISMKAGSVLMLWQSLKILSWCEQPISFFIEGNSMYPTYNQDILFLTWWDEPVVTGDVVLYKLDSQEMLNISRVISVQDRGDDDFYYLTKGDNNPVDDRGLYDNRALWLHKDQIKGKVRGYLPYLGYFFKLLNEYIFKICFYFVIVYKITSSLRNLILKKT